MEVRCTAVGQHLLVRVTGAARPVPDHDSTGRGRSAALEKSAGVRRLGAVSSSTAKLSYAMRFAAAHVPLAEHFMSFGVLFR